MLGEKMRDLLMSNLTAYAYILLGQLSLQDDFLMNAYLSKTQL